MTSAWARLGALTLLSVLVMLGALASGCGGSADAEAENDDSCGCYTAIARLYGSADGLPALKRFLMDSAARHPEGSEFQKAYSRALARFSELEIYYADSLLTSDERWDKVNAKMMALMWPTEPKSNTTSQGF